MWNQPGRLKMAIGSVTTTRPSASSNPTGNCIQAFTPRTRTPESMPLTAITTPHHQWATGPSRSHP
jgi:hypothetical protein